MGKRWRAHRRTQQAMNGLSTPRDMQRQTVPSEGQHGPESISEGMMLMAANEQDLDTITWYNLAGKAVVKATLGPVGWGQWSIQKGNMADLQPRLKDAWTVQSKSQGSVRLQSTSVRPWAMSQRRSNSLPSGSCRQSSFSSSVGHGF